MPSIVVHLPTALRDRTAGASRVTVEAESVHEALSAVATRHPDLERLLFGAPGILRGHINVFVDDRQVENGATANGHLRDGTEIRIVPSIAGG